MSVDNLVSRGEKSPLEGPNLREVLNLLILTNNSYELKLFQPLVFVGQECRITRTNYIFEGKHAYGLNPYSHGLANDLNSLAKYGAIKRPDYRQKRVTLGALKVGDTLTLLKECHNPKSIEKLGALAPDDLMRLAQITMAEKGIRKRVQVQSETELKSLLGSMLFPLGIYESEISRLLQIADELTRIANEESQQ